MVDEMLRYFGSGDLAEWYSVYLLSKAVRNHDYVAETTVMYVRVLLKYLHRRTLL